MARSDGTKRDEHDLADVSEANEILWAAVPDSWFVGQWRSPEGRHVTVSFDPTPRGDLTVDGHLGWMVTADTEAASLLELAAALRELTTGRVPKLGTATNVLEVRAAQRANRVSRRPG